VARGPQVAHTWCRERFSNRKCDNRSFKIVRVDKNEKQVTSKGNNGAENKEIATKVSENVNKRVKSENKLQGLIEKYLEVLAKSEDQIKYWTG
jgi:hypothetical protein